MEKGTSSRGEGVPLLSALHCYSTHKRYVSRKRPSGMEGGAVKALHFWLQWLCGSLFKH